MEYKICTHIYDDGHTCGCGSAAAKDRDYCTYHPVRQRASLPVPRSNAVAQISAGKHVLGAVIVQIGEALTADMIDLKRAV